MNIYSETIEGSTHYLGDKTEFNVSSEGPSSARMSRGETLNSVENV